MTVRRLSSPCPQQHLCCRVPSPSPEAIPTPACVSVLGLWAVFAGTHHTYGEKNCYHLTFQHLSPSVNKIDMDMCKGGLARPTWGNRVGTFHQNTPFYLAKAKCRGAKLASRSRPEDMAIRASGPFWGRVGWMAWAWELRWDVNKTSNLRFTQQLIPEPLFFLFSCRPVPWGSP
ncbi:hypothetical protein B0T24DRAFT_301658 [Lasiosphaeria ovina]|uniref:Uncharacterized protein n=1 Tax=Lasiosphaeria ovina TaxID=92902 RepID=A0AAE0K614_9PEZI|nr:hypothetical protein B0T24DRAFT_301658 [Lasiosphaeria ovina]